MSDQKPAFQIDHAQRDQFQRDGYFILESALTAEQLESLREEAARFKEQLDAEMERQGVTKIGITHKDSRYFISNRFKESPKLREFLFSELMADICRATLGEDAFLFHEQFVLKAAEKGMAFGWHQDSGYIGYPHRPYLSCWCALDDMTIENGTVYLLSYDKAGTRKWIPHTRDEATSDMIGYRGDEAGIPAIVPAGSIAVFSSTVFHRSGTNTTDRMRHVYLAQYTAEPIMKPDGSGLWGNAVPFLKHGKNVFDAAVWKQSGN